MALRLYGTFKSSPTTIVNPDYTDEYTVSVYDSDFLGTESEFDIISCNLYWNSSDEEDLYAPVFGSRASVKINVPASNTDLTGFIDDFIVGENGRFLVEITKTVSPTVVWRGILKPDQSGYDDSDPFIFDITGVCGISHLKEEPFLVDGAWYHGRRKFYNLLIVALTKMPHVSTFWTGSEVFLRTAVDWWSTGMASGADDDALVQAGVDAYVFHKQTTQGPIEDSVMNCYDVVVEILRAFGCRMYQAEGAWRIEQVSYRSTSPYYTRDYDVIGNFLSSAANTGANVLNQTWNGAKMTLVNYDFLPPLKKARVIYEGKMRRNLLNGYNLDADSDTIDFDQFVDANGGDTAVRLRGTVYYSVANNGYPGGANDKLYIVPNVRLKIGSNYLKRDYTLSNYTITLSDAYWNTNSANRVYLPHAIGTAPPVGEAVTGYYSFEVLSPSLPSDGEENELFFAIGSIYKWNGTLADPADLDVTWSVSGLYLDVFDEGVMTEQEDEVIFEAVNPNAASEVYEQKLKIGNSDSFGATAGRIFFRNGTVWEPADLWGQGSDPRSSHICDILALDVLNSKISPRRRMNASIYGNFRITRLVQTSDGREWYFSRIDWNLPKNIMTGSWLELDFGADGVSSTPVKVKIIKGSPGPLVEPANPNGLSSGQPGFSINPAPAVLAPIAYNQLDTEIAEGATVTSIFIKTASSGNEFLPGDGVTLVNPYTGQFQTFEIATAPGPGDLSLSVVSQAAICDYPEDSFLVVKQNAYSFRLPQGTNEGQILRWNDTDESWEVYSGTTDGHVLTWDTVNGWQSEASAAGVTDGDKGDITVSGSGSVWDIDAGAVGTAEMADNAVTDAKMRDSAALSVIGRSANSAGDPADISAANDGEVLRRSGAAIGFGTVATTGISDDAVTFAKIQNIATDRLLGRDTAATGNVEEISLNATLEFDGSLNLRRAALTGDVTAAAGSNATTIANDAVTYAKMQNVAANNVLLGNDSGAGSNVQELTAAEVYTLLSLLNGANKRIPYYTGANAMSASDDFIWDNGIKQLKVSTTLNGNPVILVAGGAITGATEFLKMSGNVNGNLIMTQINSHNASASSHAIYQISVGGSSAGDPVIQFTVSGVVTHAVGIDNSDSDKFKITPNASGPGGNANASFVGTNAATPLWGINNDSPEHPLDVGGVVRATHFIGTGDVWDNTHVSFGSGAGTGPSVSSISGSHNWFQITFLTGTAPAADAVIITFAYPEVFPGSITYPVFSPRGNRNAADHIDRFWVNNATNTGFELKSGTALQASTTYALTFNLGGYSS